MTKRESNVASILDEVLDERINQDMRWGQQNHGVALWMLILGEEVGEAMKEANEVHFRGKSPAEYRAELIQVAAVAAAAVEALDRGYA